MKYIFSRVVFASLVLLTSTYASAGLISLTERQIQTQDGQNFSFSFDLQNWDKVSNLWFFFEIQADLNSRSEYARIFINGDYITRYSGSSTLGDSGWGNFRWNTTNSCGDNDNVCQGSWSRFYSPNYVISKGWLNNNNTLDLLIDFSSNVHREYGNIWWKKPFTRASVQYTESVTEPSTLAIFALGMMGLAVRRFNKKS